MELNVYQKKAMETCMPTCANISYMLLNLVGEVGEFASKIAKGIRKGEMVIKKNELHLDFNHIERECFAALDESLMAECGDIMWQLSGLCTVMGWDWKELPSITSKNSQSGKRTAR